MLVVCSLERILAKSAKAFYSLASNKYTMDLEDRFAACSGGKVRFSSVQRAVFLNLELN